jgi:hypothetical protein
MADLVGVIPIGIHHLCATLSVLGVATLFTWPASFTNASHAPASVVLASPLHYAVGSNASDRSAPGTIKCAPTTAASHPFQPASLSQDGLGDVG